MKIFILTIFLALATVNAKPQLDLLKKVSDTVTGALDGCKGKESSFATKPGNYGKSFNVMEDNYCERLHADIQLKLAGLPGTALDYFTIKLQSSPM